MEDSKAPVFAANAPDTVTVFTDPGSLICADTVSLDLTSFISDCATGDDLALTNTEYPGNLSGADASGIY
ncbi:MAG: hypothetical protein IPL65_04630 [Lewinellaceae bacterium]|nr:hypothetical protein [Lewinellaceae bacterium]